MPCGFSLLSSPHREANRSNGLVGGLLGLARGLRNTVRAATTNRSGVPTETSAASSSSKDAKAETADATDDGQHDLTNAGDPSASTTENDAAVAAVKTSRRPAGKALLTSIGTRLGSLGEKIGGK